MSVAPRLAVLPSACLLLFFLVRSVFTTRLPCLSLSPSLVLVPPYNLSHSRRSIAMLFRFFLFYSQALCTDSRLVVCLVRMGFPNLDPIHLIPV